MDGRECDLPAILAHQKDRSRATHFLRHRRRRIRKQFEHKAVIDSEDVKAWDELMFHARRAHSMALVFPKSPAIDDFFAANAVFENSQEAFS